MNKLLEKMSPKQIMNDLARQDDSIHRLSDAELAELQRSLLSITADIDRACRKHDIKLFVVGGSALGAFRHGGFIPWDDDMDVGMLRSDYRKFITIFDEELGSKYMLRCPNSPYPNGNRFMQVYKKGTVLKTADDHTPQQPYCIYVDVFPYDFAPNRRLMQILKGCWSNLVMLIASCACSRTCRTESQASALKKTSRGKALYYIQNIIGMVFSFHSPTEWFDIVDNTIACDRPTKYITSATGRKHYLGELYPTECFFPLQEVPFDELNLYAPRCLDVYLRGLYGDDYMTPPPPEKRESHNVVELKT